MNTPQSVVVDAGRLAGPEGALRELVAARGRV
jgi:hypothetical protein